MTTILTCISCFDFVIRLKFNAFISGLAPDIMRGICPHPCDDCKRGKIQKVMSTIAKKYPKQWNEMVREFGRRTQQRTQ